MKKSILIASFFLGTYAFAQTAEQRAVIQKDINPVENTKHQIRLEEQYNLQQQKIEIYLQQNPTAKKTYTSNGNLYMLQYIDEQGNPMYISTKDSNQVTNSKANALYQGGSVGVNITGSNMVAGVWDGGQVNAQHELLVGQAVMQPGQTNNDPLGNDHMQAVTSIMVGKILTNSSNSLAATARGIAPNATTKNYDWVADIAEMNTFGGQGYLISNHSYGLPNDYTTPLWTFGAYNQTAEAWDYTLKSLPNYLPFVAVGNEQSPTKLYPVSTPPKPSDGQHTNGNFAKGGFDMITGSSASKNVMTVGAINANNTMTDYSNWGPADDGRVKPDLVTLGSNINVAEYVGNNAYTGLDPASSGTSYSAPAAAAAGLLLQQYYYSIFAKYMTAASLKALMLHTADDAGNPGPDAKFGWGILNVEKAAQTIKQMQNGGSAKLIESIINPVNNSQAETIHSVGQAAAGDLRTSLCWTDDEGVEQTAADGVNNTTSRLVYNFDFLFRSINATNTKLAYSYKPLSVTNPNAAAVPGTTLFQNNVDNYKQGNITGAIDSQFVTMYVTKSASSPISVRNYSVLITGLKITNATLAVNENVKSQNTIFYTKEDGKIKMISNNTKNGFGNFKIYDMSGKLLKAGTERGNEISFENNSSGVYILTYQNAGKEETFKFKK